MATPRGVEERRWLEGRIRRSECYGDDYIPSGCIPDVLKGGIRRLSDGCYSFSDIMDLVAHHIVWTGEAADLEARLRAGITVREFLRERYRVATGASEKGDKSDLRRFRLWLADAKWRIRKMRADEKRRALWRRVTTWNRETPGRVM